MRIYNRPISAAEAIELYSSVTKNVRDFGARGDGIADDTLAFRAAVAAIPETGGTLYIPQGTYGLTGNINLKSNIVVKGAGGLTILKSIKTGSWGDTGILQILPGVSQVTISDLVIDGNKIMSPSGTLYGIYIGGGTDVTIERITSKNMPGSDLTGTRGGDGVYIGSRVLADGSRVIPKNITVRDSTFDGNVRQGISIVSGSNILIERSKFINTTGTNPGAGIDIEPNAASETTEMVTIKDSLFDNNQYGLQIYNSAQAKMSDFTISNNIFSNNRKQGMRLFYANLYGKNFLFENNTVSKNGEDGILAFASDNIAVLGNTIERNGLIGTEFISSNSFKFSNNTVRLNGQHGITTTYKYGGASGREVIGNKIFNNGVSVPNTYDGLLFIGNATHPNFGTLVQGNTFGNDAALGAPTQRYGILIEKNVYGITGSNNIFSNNLGAPPIVDQDGRNNASQF